MLLFGSMIILVCRVLRSGQGIRERGIMGGNLRGVKGRLCWGVIFRGGGRILGLDRWNSLVLRDINMLILFVIINGSLVILLIFGMILLSSLQLMVT